MRDGGTRYPASCEATVGKAGVGMSFGEKLEGLWRGLGRKAGQGYRVEDE